MHLPTPIYYHILSYAPCWDVEASMLAERRKRLLRPLPSWSLFRRVGAWCDCYVSEYGMFGMPKRHLSFNMRYTEPNQKGMWMISSEYLGAGYHRVLWIDGTRFEMEIKG